MQPIKFRVTYADTCYGDEREGFERFSNEKEIVTAMHVDLMVLEWSNGVYLQVDILEDVTPKSRFDTEGVIHWDRSYERKVQSIVVYDHPQSTDGIKPTMEQALLMQAMHNGELRGEYANRIAGALYVDLVVLHSKSDFGDYLPKVKAYYEGMVEKGYWDRKKEL